MECYEGATMIKTFRGLIADDSQDTIVLHTNDGSTGYRIVKFQIMPNDPGNSAYENVVQIWKVAQTTISDLIDFSDNTLLAAAYLEGDGSRTNPSTDFISFFDKEVFNQDIYITHKDDDQTSSVNYYIELEQIKLDLNENTVATLKDIRNIKRTTTG